MPPKGWQILLESPNVILFESVVNGKSNNEEEIEFPKMFFPAWRNDHWHMKYISERKKTSRN